MPTINQLPVAPQVNSDDELPISQAGTTRSATIGSLLATTQPVITTATSTLLGRVSLGPGGPEPIAIGAGLALSAGSLVANGTDHASFPPAPGLIPTDQAVISSAGQPRVLPLSQLRGLFTPGANVAIDPNGVISATASGTSISTAPTTNSIAPTDLIGISQNGKDRAIPMASLIAAANVSKATLLPTGTTTPTLLADHAARVINPKDFGAKGDGTTDDQPSFVAAIASSKGSPVTLHVSRPAVSYSISQIVVGLNASVVIDDGVTFSGSAGSAPFFVGRIEQRTNGLFKTIAQGSATGTAVCSDTDVINSGPNPAYGETFQYQSFMTTDTIAAGDIARSESAHWHNGPGPGMMGHWFVTCSPDPADAPTAVYGMSASEVNVVNNFPQTAWQGTPAGLNQWACGFNFVPDAGYQFQGHGGHVLYGWGVNQNGGANKAGIVPKTYNGFFVGNDAIAPGGRAVYVVGDTTNLAANFPHAPFEAGTGNWTTGIRTDTATIASGNAVQIAANQAIAWVSPTENVVAGIFSGTGAPAIPAPAGSIYARRDGGPGTTLYVKETGTAQPGWMPYAASGTASIATQASLGLVKIGANLTIAADGTLAATAPVAGPAGPQGVAGTPGATWSPPKRGVSSTTDVPTIADDGGLIAYTSASAITVTATDLGANRSYSVMQQGAGQVTIVAATGVILVSDKAAPSFTSARRGAIMSVLCDGNGNAYVIGNTQ